MSNESGEGSRGGWAATKRKGIRDSNETRREDRAKKFLRLINRRAETGWNGWKIGTVWYSFGSVIRRKISSATQRSARLTICHGLTSPRGSLLSRDATTILLLLLRTRDGATGRSDCLRKLLSLRERTNVGLNCDSPSRTVIDTTSKKYIEGEWTSFFDDLNIRDDISLAQLRGKFKSIFYSIDKKYRLIFLELPHYFLFVFYSILTCF